MTDRLGQHPRRRRSEEKHLGYRTILEELGEPVVCVSSGREALRHLLVKEFAVILMDVNMPGMDGFETAALIRQRRKDQHTPIIFITAWADEVQQAQGYSRGAVDYILSPVVPEILCAKVKVFVDLYRMRRGWRVRTPCSNSGWPSGRPICRRPTNGCSARSSSGSAPSSGSIFWSASCRIG